MRRASYMGLQKWQILPFISVTFPSHFSSLNSHFQPAHSPLTFPSQFPTLPSHFLLSLLNPPPHFLSLFNPLTSFSSHFLLLNSHFPLSLFNPPPHFPSHFSPLNSHIPQSLFNPTPYFPLSCFIPQLSLSPLIFG